MVKLKKNVTIVTILTIIIFALFTYKNISEIPDTLYVKKSVETSTIKVSNNIFIKDNKENNKLKLKLFGIIPIKTVKLSKIEDIEIYPGGTAIGIKLSTEGVLVVGYSDINTFDNRGKIESPAKEQGMLIGDVIVKINNKEIANSVDFVRLLRSIDKEIIEVEFIRDDIIYNKSLSLGKEEDGYKLGLWIRDSTAGIGTLTFYHKESNTYGALGHPITDGDTNEPFLIKDGDILDATIMNVRRGEKGLPGELKGLFNNENISLGSINKNTNSGIYGEVEKDIICAKYNKPLSIGLRNEIVEGPAEIITTIDDKGPEKYCVEIIKILPQDEVGPKSMVIKVTDEKLLEKTGGIVQGMSGSPIIQNNKIIGAVTHVLVNKPEIGYGIYIEWMLQDSDIIE